MSERREKLTEEGKALRYSTRSKRIDKGLNRQRRNARLTHIFEGFFHSPSLLTRSREPDRIRYFWGDFILLTVLERQTGKPSTSTAHYAQVNLRSPCPFYPHSCSIIRLRAKLQETPPFALRSLLWTKPGSQMERESRSPEIESNECAGSPEASSTRPNPFKGGDESSRKRRRTSLNVDSRSRSVESNTHSPHDTPTIDKIDLSSSPPVNEEELDDSVMIMDARPAPSSPHTPENNTTNNADSGLPAPGPPGLEARPPTGPSPHVTLSLRNSSRRTLDTIPSSPPASPTPTSRPHDRDAAKSSVEHPDDSSMASPDDRTASSGAAAVTAATEATSPTVHGTTLSSVTARSRTTSPQIEVVDIVSDDDDAGFGPTEPDVTLLSEDPSVLPNTLVQDPSGEFPYLSNGDPPPDIMMVLMGPLTQGMSLNAL